MKKKYVRKQFDKIKRTNHDCLEYIEYLKGRYVFTSGEEKHINVMEDHLINLNVFFTNLEKEM